MRKRKVAKLFGGMLAALCIASSCITTNAAQKNSEKFWKNVEICEEDFAEPQGGVVPDEATPISEEEAEEIHEAFEKLQGIESYSVPSVNSGYASNYGYSTLTTEQERSCYAEIKTAAYQFHEQYKEPILRQKKDDYGNVTDEYYVWAEFVIDKKDELTAEQAQKVLFAVEADCPEFFWFSGSFSYAHIDGVVTKIYPKIEKEYIESEIRKQTQENIETGMNPYLEAIDQAKATGIDDMSMELLIHDMILEAVDYEYIPGTKTPQSAAYAHSIAGVFQQTGVVCEGYAKAFQLLMTYAGIDSIYAVGYGNGGGHAWNLVYLDGAWYNIDLTWDDTGTDFSYNDGIRYRYYNCDTDFFGNHVYMPTVFKGMYEVPETHEQKYNYYQYYGLYVTAEVMAEESTFLNFMDNVLIMASDRGDYLLQFAFDSENTRNLFKEYLETYQDNFLENVSNNERIYKMAGGSTCTSGTPYNMYVPMLKIYADTYEVEYREEGAELTFHMVKGRREILQEGNYQVAYLDNTLAGQAKAIVSGQGSYDYIGDNEFTFYVKEKPTITPKPTATPKLIATSSPTITIQPALEKVTGLKLVSAGKDNIKIQFEKQPFANGYEVVLYQGKKQKKKAVAEKTVYTFQKLSAATDYTVKVRAYTKQSDRKTYGNYSNSLKVATATKAPVIKSLQKGKQKVVISWKKVSNATGYEIYMSSKKKSGFKKIGTVKKASTVSYTKTRLKSKKSYYFKVRTYRTVGGKKIYSPYSKVKSTKL